jgi:hypothetical protein
MTAHPGATATISAGVTGTQQADVMASFSSRGGPGQTLGVSKPDITAPGVQILAGHTPASVDLATGPTGQLFQAIAGTSMSSPHIAGSGALLKDLHPTWTPGQIKSALMTTAKTSGLKKEDGTTPFNAFDAGSGRVDLRVAGDPGLTFDVTGAEYLAHPTDLYTTNYPSIYHPSMPGVITLTRTAHNLQGSKTEWKLKATSPSDFKISVPSKIKLDPNADKSFDIKLDASAVPLGQVRFGTITLTQSKGGHRVLHLPVTIVRGQAALTWTKSCTPTDIAKGAITSCTLTLVNPTLNDATYVIADKMPKQLKLDPTSIVGGFSNSDEDKVKANGTIPASQPPNVTIAPGSSPAGGYLPLSAYGIPPIAGVGDDTITNFNVPAFTYAGGTYTSVGVSSNGYVVVGGGSGPDNSINNQNFPNVARPNNVLALFWTDLNPAAAGAVRIGTLTDGADTWIVVDWAGVREFSSASKVVSFETWIGVNGDAHPAEDISYAYGAITGGANGDGGFLTVGAENVQGNRGQNTYFNGVGSLPTNGTQLRVAGTAGTTSSLTITFNASGKKTGAWRNCATLDSDAFLGTSYACQDGNVH